MARHALGPAQLELVQALAPELQAWSAGAEPEPLTIALSGGADSVALAAAVAYHLAAGQPREVCAVVVDHALQPDSAEVAARAAGLARSLGLAARVESVQVCSSGQGLEAAAREARLAALTRGGGTVLLGHTLDDQAEQVLLGLARGSGPGSVQGMAPIRRQGTARLVRPLLGVRRATTRQACREWGLPVWDDPMNADPRFGRVRVRHQLMPVLAEVLGPGTAEALARTARLARQDAELLTELAEAAWQGRPDAAGQGLDCAWLAGQPAALRGRLLRRWLAGRGVASPSLERTEAVLALVLDWRGQGAIDLPGGRRVLRRQGLLVCTVDKAG